LLWSYICSGKQHCGNVPLMASPAPPDVESPAKSSKSKKEAEQERRLAEAKKHVKELESQVVIKSPEELKASAKDFRDQNACTLYDETTKQYKYRSCCGTKVSDLGVYGVGVALYFQFIRQMGVVFLLCAIVLGPNLAFNIMGNMVNENSALYKYLGMTTIGNLGACEGALCETDEDLRNRCLIDEFPCETMLKEVTQWLGMADGIGILLVLAWGIFFQACHIPRMVRLNDDANLTPSDFAIDIPVLPYQLQDGHKQYQEKLKNHFLGVLKRLEFNDGDGVVEVCLVRDYEGAISTFLAKGDLILAEHGDVIRMKALEGKDDAASKAKYQKLEKATHKKYDKMMRMDNSIRSQADKSDDDRGVVRAFVIFAKETYKKAVLEEYRFSQYSLFRCCQGEPRRFEGYTLKVQNACEPSDLYWENLDFAWWKRGCRICFVVLLTLIFLIVCAASLVYFQSLSKSTLASLNENVAWVIKGNGTECLNFCDVELFADRLCSGNGDTSKTWDTVKVFDQFSDYDNGYAWSGICTNPWTSSCTSATRLAEVSGCDGDSGSINWVGFEFAETQQVQCWQATLTALAREVQVFGCPVAPPPMAERGCWKVEENCAPMYPNTLTPPTTGTWTARDNKISADMSCSLDIELHVAQERWASFEEGSTERVSNPIINCFCQQQVLNVGPEFLFPPYDTEEKLVCQDWLVDNSLKIAKVIGAAAAVLVINQLLLLIYEFLVAFERHCTVTEVAQSQFWKLFLAQMVNTGLLVLLVNASLDLPEVLMPLRVLQIGTGQFDELSVSWYISVGTGICLTIFMQVFSTTVPPLIMAFVVGPCLQCIFGRGEVVEARLQRIYQLPKWNLSLRMAQTLTVIFVICMYSGGMPILYFVGFVYSIVAFWLDKWCLLHGSSKPPAYNQAIVHTCLNFLPLAAFFHTVIAGWSWGNQELVPSEWSRLFFVVEIIFGKSKEDYENIVSSYNAAPARDKPSMQWDYYEARMMDMAREGSWLIFCTFVAFVVYYVLLWSYKLLLRPFLSPFVFAIRECCCCCCSRRRTSAGDQSWDTCVQECRKHSTLTSYLLKNNPSYHSAAVAIAHGDLRAQRRISEADAPEEATL